VKNVCTVKDTLPRHQRLDAVSPEIHCTLAKKVKKKTTVRGELITRINSYIRGVFVASSPGSQQVVLRLSTRLRTESSSVLTSSVVAWCTAVLPKLSAVVRRA